MSVVDNEPLVSAAKPHRERGAEHGYIPEVQGLRTVALVLVAAFHIWFGGVSGGVDVFLLISAFLLTRSLTRSSVAGHRPHVIRTVVKKFARLLPLAATAIALTVIAALLLLPIGVLGSVLGDAGSALTYTMNFHLQALEVDYYALQTSHASLFQQFWSLSIQGQVFVAWPVLHLLGFGLSKLLRVPVRAVLTTIFSLVFIASLTWSIIYTAENQTLAYFDTFARAWEFAAGSLLALAMPFVRLSDVWRTVLGWLGILAILSCGFVLPVESSFPGYAALWPVLAAAAVILSAGPPTRFGADRVLSTGPLRRAGSYTYALYLVHWPVLVIFLILIDSDRADALGGFFVFSLSAAFAVGMTVIVERPTARFLSAARHTSVGSLRTRFRPVGRPLAVIAAFALASTVLLASSSQHYDTVMAEAADHIEESISTEPTGLLSMGANNPGAPIVSTPIPEAVVAQQDYVLFGEWCQPGLMFGFSGELCFDQLGADPDAPLFLAIGNSHSQQLAVLGLELNRVTGGIPDVRSHTMPGCIFDLPESDAIATDCQYYWLTLAEYILQPTQPEMVVLLGTMSQPDGSDIIFPGLASWLTNATMLSPNTQFVVVRDNPRFETSPLECAIDNGWSATECSQVHVPTDLGNYPLEIEATGAMWVDLSTVICPNFLCRPQLGEVVTYFDDNHLTGTFVTTLTPAFSRVVATRVWWWPADIIEQAGGVFSAEVPFTTPVQPEEPESIDPEGSPGAAGVPRPRFRPA